jgi:phospholipid/cholesterol/gamma-HCH transport system permease protein
MTAALTEKRRGALEALGARAVGALAYAGGMALLLGATLRWALLGLFSRRVPFAGRALAEQLVRAGLRSVGIVVLVQAFIGVILALQMTPPLEPWGQTDKVANIIGVAGFRMLGPIITAIVLSGFAGASIAAELGTMVVAEEIEALEAIALNPVRFLVVPRVLATFFATVLLAVVADVTIAFGGYLTSLTLGPQSYVGYWQRMQEQLLYRDFLTGLTQAGVFGILVGLIACHEGLSVRGGAEGVGRATTRTVVYSIVAIIGAACVFTVVFYVYGW